MIFDHVGIVVQSLAAGRAMLGLLGVRRWTREWADPINDVWVQFGPDASGICYELVAPLSGQSPVSRALRTGNNITNHVAYRVADLAGERERLLSADFTPVADARPAIAYGDAPIQYLMSPIGSLVELIEAPEHSHDFREADGRG